jgi:hypothetical protein
VRSLFDYLSTVWDPHLQQDIDRIENVQRRAARFIYSDYKRQQVKSAPNKIVPKSNRSQVKSSPSQIGPRSNRIICYIYIYIIKRNTDI